MGKMIHFRFLLQLVLLLWFSAISKSLFFRRPALSTLNQARCQAFCMTQFPGKSGKNQTAECVNTDCQSCLQLCKSTQKELIDCVQNCGANSACKSSCQFIAKLGNEASYTEQIDTPGIPTVVSSSFTTVSLSWKKPTNVTKEVVVYVVEMKYGGDLTTRGWRALNIITTDTYANVTDLFLCKTIRNFYSLAFRHSYNGLHYQFRIVALTKNSSAARSGETKTLRLQKPEPARNVSFKILHYNDASGDKLFFFGKWLPVDGADWYYVRWLNSGRACYDRHGHPHRTQREQVPNITYNVPHSQKNGCPNTFQVYVLNGCSFSRPVAVKVINQGCRHIANYPLQDCCKVHQPTPEHPKDLIVRNLRRSYFSVTKDFKYSFNITWDSPPYFQQTGCTDLHRGYNIRFGDPTKLAPCRPPFCFVRSWGKQKSLSKVNFFEVNGINEGIQFKFVIDTTGFRLHLLGNKKTEISFTVAPSSQELKVKTLSTLFVTSSVSVNSKVSWKEPAFNSGFLEYYLITYNGKSITLPANATNLLIKNTQLNLNLQVKVKPVYSHIKFVGITSEIQASPKSNRYKIRNLSKWWKDLPEGPALHISWEKPISKRNVSYYVVDYEIHKLNALVTRQSGNTMHSNYTIAAGSGNLTFIVFKVTPKFESSIVRGATTIFQADFDNKCNFSILSGSSEEKQSEQCLNGGVCSNKVSDYECKCKKDFTGKRCEVGIGDTLVSNVNSSRLGEDQLKISWDKPKMNAKILYYEVSYKVKKSNVMMEHVIKTSNLSINIKEGAKPSRITSYKVRAIFNDSSIEGQFSKVQKAPQFVNMCAVRILSGSRGETQSVQCLNGGLCVNKVSDFECKCKKDFTGKRCEVGIGDTQVSNVKSSRLGEDQLKISWDKPKTKAKISYYEVSYKVKKSDGTVEREIKVSNLSVIIKQEEKLGRITTYKVRAVFADSSVEGQFSKVKEVEDPSVKSGSPGASTSKLTKPQIIGICVGIAALVFVSAMVTIIVYKHRKTTGSYTRKSFRMEKR